jgi:hypothetical protein
MQLIVDNQVFYSKAALARECRQIVGSYTLGQSLDVADHSFISALFERHPDAEQKKGAGIDQIYVVRNEHGSIGFELTRIDGTRTDISWTQCITASTHRAKVLSALRQAIYEQIKDFRYRAFTPKMILQCPITNETITAAACHIDHAAPNTFAAIVAQFITSENLDIHTIPLRPHGDGDQFERLEDAALDARWRFFHQDHATLRAVSKRANLSLLRR